MADVHLVFVEFGRDHERAALDLLHTTLARVFPGAAIRTIVVDNASASGDNSAREFSGWERGLARCPDAPSTMIVLANDTIVRPDKAHRLQNLPAERAGAAAGGAIVGWVEEYPRPIALFGLPLRQFVDTSFVVATRGTLASLGPFQRPPADAAIFDDDWRTFFREPSPLSANYRAYLRTYFFGEPIDPDFNQRWYAHAPLGEHNADAFRTKIRCVLTEHLLSARARARGIPLVDIRPRRLALDPVVPPLVATDARRPRVSVVVPCFNLGAFLDETIDSVLAQSFQDFEIVVVDDGSTDGPTQELLAGYQRPKTRVVRAGRNGLGGARNIGAAQSRGAYLCFLDADDRIAPSFLEKTVRAIEGDPPAGFASTWLRTFGDERWEWTPGSCDLPALLCEDTVLTASLVRRDAFDAVGGFDATMPVQGDEDWDFWLTLVERGFRGVIVPEVLFDYRRRHGSMCDVAWYGQGHLPLANYRFAKHRESYRRHREQVFLFQDGETSGLLRKNDELERRIASELEPAVALRRATLASLQARLAPPPPAGRNEEALALRGSMSWRITAPLRAVYDQWLRFKPGGRA